MSEPPTNPALHAAIETLLLEGGGLGVTDLIAALSAAGHHLGPHPEGAVLDTLEEAWGAPFIPLGPVWAHLPALLRGRTFTHRVTGPEVDHDLLTFTPDLAAVPGLEDNDLLQLADGGELSIAYPPTPDDDDEVEVDDPREQAVDKHGSLVLPPGTLGGLGIRAGDLLAVRVTDRALDLVVIDDQPPPYPDTVRSRLLEIAGGSAPVELETAILTLCAEPDDAFRGPHPPFGDLLTGGELTRHGGWIAPEGFDFGAYWSGVRARSLAEQHHLSHDQGMAVAALLRMLRDVREVFVAAYQSQTPEGELDQVAFVTALRSATATSGPDRTVRSMLHHVAAPRVAEAFLTEANIWDDQLVGAALAMMVELMEDSLGRAARPALRWLRAMAYEQLGRITEAEETLLTAERLDPTWPLTLLDLARYASDRGDASRGLALLARADPYEDPDLEKLLQAFRPEPGPTVGRNDPCWCGSGRKFKQCHLHRPRVAPLAERAAWLYQKADTFLSSGAWYPLVSVIAAERAAYAEGDAAVEAAVLDPLVADVALFEGGAFAEFVGQRGFLLPADEQLMAEAWLLVERSVFDVTAVRRGAGFTVRDLRTGEVHDVRERTASRQLKPGELICARVVPAGETWQIFGGIEPVALHDRDALLELLDTSPEPDELMAFLARRYAPPTLVTAEGDTQSIALSTIREADPAVRVRSEVRQPIAEALAASGIEPGSVAPGLIAPEDQPPEVQQAIAAYMQNYEKEWLDLPVPALNGLTPRQAAEDPTRRGDLVRLLASFPDTDGPTEMSARRLRAALGLNDDRSGRRLI